MPAADGWLRVQLEEPGVPLLRYLGPGRSREWRSPRSGHWLGHAHLRVKRAFHNDLQFIIAASILEAISLLGAQYLIKGEEKLCRQKAPSASWLPMEFRKVASLWKSPEAGSPGERSSGRFEYESFVVCHDLARG
jgi:hypothetical protein